MLQIVQNVQAYVEVRVGVVVHVHSADIGLAGGKVQLFHLVHARVVHVDGVFMQKHGHGEAVHLAHYAVMGGVGDVDDDKVFRARAAQADFAGGKLLLHPVILVVHMAQDVVFRQVFQKLRRIGQAAETLALLKGQLIGGALDVRGEHVEVVGLHQACSGEARKK